MIWKTWFGWKQIVTSHCSLSRCVAIYEWCVMANNSRMNCNFNSLRMMCCCAGAKEGLTGIIYMELLLERNDNVIPLCVWRPFSGFPFVKRGEQISIQKLSKVNSILCVKDLLKLSEKNESAYCDLWFGIFFLCFQVKH